MRGMVTGFNFCSCRGTVCMWVTKADGREVSPDVGLLSKRWWWSPGLIQTQLFGGSVSPISSRMGWSFSAPACPVRDVLGQAGKEIMELALQKKSWRTMSTYTDRTKEGSCSFLEYLHLLSTVPLLLQHSVNSSMLYICQ